MRLNKTAVGLSQLSIKVTGASEKTEAPEAQR